MNVAHGVLDGCQGAMMCSATSKTDERFVTRGGIDHVKYKGDVIGIETCAPRQVVPLFTKAENPGSQKIEVADQHRVELRYRPVFRPEIFRDRPRNTCGEGVDAFPIVSLPHMALDSGAYHVRLVGRSGPPCLGGNQRHDVGSAVSVGNDISGGEQRWVKEATDSSEGLMGPNRSG